jgi:hypothetical protein
LHLFAANLLDPGFRAGDNMKRVAENPPYLMNFSS